MRTGQVRHGARRELGHCHDLNLPEGCDQVRDDPSARAMHESDVKATVQLCEGFPLSPHLGNLVDQPVELLVVGSPENGTDLIGLTQVDSPPHFDHLAKRLLLFPMKHAHAESQRLHQGTEGGVPDEGSPTVLDLDDIQGAEGPHSFPD